jgi:hypothetical protein
VVADEWLATSGIVVGMNTPMSIKCIDHVQHDPAENLAHFIPYFAVAAGIKSVQYKLIFFEQLKRKKRIPD